MPNSDPGNNDIYLNICKFVEKKLNTYLFKSLGRETYYNLLRYVDAVVGNSSSGILEVHYFRKPTINIGDRQKGRLTAKSIINTKNNSDDISKAINKIYDINFKKSIPIKNSLYGEGGASLKIRNVLKTIDYNKIIKKEFFDIRN